MATTKKFTLREFFDQYGLNQGELAKRAGINANVLRAQVCGFKEPSEERLKIIEQTIHKLGKELQKIKLIA